MRFPTFPRNGHVLFVRSLYIATVPKCKNQFNMNINTQMVFKLSDVVAYLKQALTAVTTAVLLLL